MAGRMIRRLDRVSAAAWGVTGLTVAGIAIRLVGFDASLYSDELSTYAAVSSSSSPAGVVDLIRADQTLRPTGTYVIELTPPLFFVLSWLTAQIGDPTETLRIPSLLAGVLTIPMVYLLGRRTVGPSAAVVAAAFATLNPFLILYSTDARAYALMALLVAASTYALLRASEAGSKWWWAAYALASCAAIYTHYVSAIVLIAQFGWALWFHRERWRPLILANLAAAIAFLPWLGEFLDDNGSNYNVIEGLAPFSLDALVEHIGRWSLRGRSTSADLVPESVAMALAGAGLLIAVAWIVARRFGATAADESAATAGPSTHGSSGLLLIVVTALAPPVFLALYSAIGPDILLARNLIAGSPALMIAFAALVTAPVASVRYLAVALTTCGLALGALNTLPVGAQRPDYRGAAEFVEAETKPGDPVFDVTLFGLRTGPLSRALDIYVDERPVEHPEDLKAAARGIEGGRIAFVIVAPEAYGLDTNGVRQLFPKRFSLVESRILPGLLDVGVYIFEDLGAPSGAGSQPATPG